MSKNTFACLLSMLVMGTAIAAESPAESPVKIHFRADFENGKPSASIGYFHMTTYGPDGEPQAVVQKEITFDKSAYAATFEKLSAKNIVLRCHPKEGSMITVSKKLWCAFCIFAEEDSGKFEIMIWNRTRKANIHLKFDVLPDTWATICLNLCKPGELDEGDEFNDLSICNIGEGSRSFVVDNIIIWEGNDGALPR